jgi:hypothetical protein
MTDSKSRIAWSTFAFFWDMPLKNQDVLVGPAGGSASFIMSVIKRQSACDKNEIKVEIRTEYIHV